VSVRIVIVVVAKSRESLFHLRLRFRKAYLSSSWSCLSFLRSQWRYFGRRKNDSGLFYCRYRCSDRWYSACTTIFWLLAQITSIASPPNAWGTTFVLTAYLLLITEDWELTSAFNSCGFCQIVRARPLSPIPLRIETCDDRIESSSNLYNDRP